MKKSNAGMGLVQMVVAVALVAIISMGTLALMTDLFKGIFSMQKRVDRTDLATALSRALSDKENCRLVLDKGVVSFPANWRTGLNHAISIGTLNIGQQTVAETGRISEGLQTKDLKIEMLAGPYPLQYNVSPEGTDPVLRGYRKYFARLVTQMVKVGGSKINVGGESLKENEFYLSLVVTDDNRLHDCTGGISETILRELCEKSFDGTFDRSSQPWCSLFNLGIGIHKDSLSPQYPRFSVLEKSHGSTPTRDLTMALYGGTSASSAGPGLWFIDRFTTPMAASGNFTSIGYANRAGAYAISSQRHDFIISNRSNNGDLEVGALNVKLKMRQANQDILASHGFNIESRAGGGQPPTASVYSTRGQGRITIGGRSDNGLSYSVLYLSSSVAGTPINMETNSWALAHKAPLSGQTDSFQVSRWWNGLHTVALSISPGLNFGVGVVNPSEKLEVGGGVLIGGNLRVNGNIMASGTVTSASERSLKKDIIPLEDSLARVLKIRPVSYVWKSSLKGEPRLGFIAQEVEREVPEVAVKGGGIWGIAYGNLTAVVVGGLKEISRSVFQVGLESEKNQRRIEKLERQLLEVLKKEIELEAENAALGSEAQIRACSR